MSYTSPQSRLLRRRRRLAILTILITGIALIAFAVAVRSEERDVSTYLDVAKQVADEHASLAAAFADLLSSIGDLQRQDLLESIGQFQEESSDLRTTLGETPVPGTVAAVHGWLTVALDSWGDALMAADSAVLLILDGPDDRTGERALRRTFDLLRVGDRAYAGFLAELGDLDEDVVALDYPTVMFAIPEREALFDAELMTDRIQAFAALEEEHNLSVTATMDPAPVGTRNEIPVVPFSETLTLNVVVSNVGNLVEETIPVRLELVSRDNSRDPIVMEETVELLNPDQATTVVFASLPLSPGGLYEAVVEVAHADDADQSDNLWNLVFIWNEPA